MLTKINKFIKSRTKEDWIVIGLWVSTLVMLLAFVVYDAVAKGVDANAANATYFANNMAIFGIVLAVVLFASIATTVIFAYLKRKRGK